MTEDIGSGPPDSITCPVCGATSYHPLDILEGYCANCHDWTTVTYPPKENNEG